MCKSILSMHNESEVNTIINLYMKEKHRKIEQLEQAYLSIYIKNLE